MKVVIYARVSTRDQDCSLQLRDCLAHVERSGWTLATQPYIDQGYSGAKLDRPALARLMQDAERRKFGAILCWRLDRFGRSFIHLCQSVEKLQGWNIRLISISDGIDTDRKSAAAKYMLHILAAGAEMERELIQERVMAGLEAARARGTKLGPPRRVMSDAEIAEGLKQGKLFPVGGRLAFRKKSRPEEYLFVTSSDAIARLLKEQWSYGRIATKLGTTKTSVRRFADELGKKGLLNRV